MVGINKFTMNRVHKIPQLIRNIIPECIILINIILNEIQS